MDLDLVPGQIHGFFVVFARMGAIVMVLPGIGEAFISPRFRLAIAVGLTFTILPFVAADLPALPAQPVGLLVQIGREIAIGLFIGLFARLSVAALHVAGTIIAFQTSLGFAQFYDPAQQAQGAVIGSFLTMMGLMVIFATDLHLLMLRAAFESYVTFPVAQFPSIGGMAEMVAQLVANAFALGLKLASPFMVYGLVLYFGMGLLNRLMPQMQVFFIVMPLNIMLGLFMLMAMLGVLMTLFADRFRDAVGQLLAT